ncbi:zinc transport system substrate-binding protein [Peptoniphilus olsenii]|uniref:Zinc transport system substrate-binding protein n=1 Tax=Peptoniphilus olsenii TaxID=411570 RepID=A0ABV2JAQ5_9FIRM
MKILKKFVVFVAAVVLLAGCSKAGDVKSNSADKGDENDGKMKVYASVYPMYDFAQKIAGDKMDVELIVPSGVEPHGWEPDQDAIKKLEQADVFIYNGAGLESWTDKVIDSLDNKDLKVVEASKGVNYIESDHDHDHEHNHEAMENHEEHNHDGNNHHEGNHNHNEENHNHEDHEHEHEHGGLDPHVWIAPLNAKIEFENIKNALAEADPENADYYEANYEEYAKKLDDLHKKYSDELSNLKNNQIVVSHEAYGYLCKEYNLEQLGIQGVNAETEPDAKKMAEITNFVKENNVKTIFTEELIDPKVAEIIALETGAEVKVLSPLEGLSQEQIENNEDYFSIMEKNLENLIGALK